MGLWVNRIQRGFNRSPTELKWRVFHELKAFFDRFKNSPISALDEFEFVKLFGARQVEELWKQLSSRTFVAVTTTAAPKELEWTSRGDFERIINLADKALSLEVNLLGSGATKLSRPINWDLDFKVNLGWPKKFFRDIDILDLDRPSDVKVPWELSRLQWLVPVGQAYMLTSEAKYAEFVRGVLTDWIESNPYGRGVNWAIAMEPAMRVFIWTWLFHVFKASDSWSSKKFRALFLRGLYEHGVFIKRYFEEFGINGNHCTADAGALVFLGLFFGGGGKTREWQAFGWKKLSEEIQWQVLNDGVDFEGSISYHRFATELFFWPARFRKSLGKEIPKAYVERLMGMAEFIQCYTKPDSLAPLLGDADDGRVFPFGGQNINDHSYLPDLIRFEWGIGNFGIASPKAKSEFFWTFGAQDNFIEPAGLTHSRCFKESGYYIMATECDHIFIDCGPVGFAGKGGHGHNDCLSFEVYLDHQPLMTDGGSYVYSASPKERNKFRSTAFHNTPSIDGYEQNNFISDTELFGLCNDSIPSVRLWETSDSVDVFVGSHSGFQKIKNPVTPVRKIILDKLNHRLICRDGFQGIGDHSIMTPFRFSPNCKVEETKSNTWSIKSNGKEYRLIAGGSSKWQTNLIQSSISPSYGVVVECPVLEFFHHGPLEVLAIGIYPVRYSPSNPLNWLGEYV